MKYCKDCKWYKSWDLACVNKDVKLFKEDPVTGPVLSEANPWYARTTSGACGPDAKYFEQKKRWFR
jgi:hypothetical protein